MTDVAQRSIHPELDIKAVERSLVHVNAHHGNNQNGNGHKKCHKDFDQLEILLNSMPESVESILRSIDLMLLQVC